MATGIHELTAGYALDALDAEERRAFEAHLPDCARCQDELRDFWETTDALAVAASGPEPSAALRGRILADARAEPQVVIPFAPRRRRTIPVLAGVAAVAAVVALALGLWASQVSGDLDDARQALESERETAAVLADPAARDVALEAGEGRLVVGQDGRAVLVLDSLDPAPAGKTYEMWIVEDEQTLPAGLFAGHDGVDIVRVDGTVAPGDVVAVTIEDEGGVEVSANNPIIASGPA
jgi:anti-sigma factor RsiW